jgi:ribosomal protein S18 acetylase RimI-like enzyme
VEGAVIAGLPDGLVARPLMRDDVDAVFRLEQTCEALDDGEAEIALSDVEAEWHRPAFDPATMSVGVFDADRLVAYAEVFGSRAEAAVAPAERGRGIGSALARWTWTIAEASGRDRVGQTISDTEDAARALFESLGYELGHTSWILRIGIDEEPPPPELPSGLALRGYRPGVDEPQMFDVIETAFSAWEGREPNAFEDWKAQFLERDEVRPELQVLAAEGDRLVGVAINYDYAEDDEGWIQQLAVHPTHQGRGLGRAILQESFRKFHALGRRSCGLSTDSRTGALGLYEHVGMRVRKSYAHWDKKL